MYLGFLVPNKITRKKHMSQKDQIPWWKKALHYRNRRILLIVLPGIGLGYPVIGQLIDRPSDYSQISTQQRHQLVSLAGYERLEIGMTLTDAQATLGQAIEVSRNEITTTYKWTNSDGSKITAVFKENRLVNKEQLGLQ
jgi:hypothetical protein